MIPELFLLSSENYPVHWLPAENLCISNKSCKTVSVSKLKLNDYSFYPTYWYQAKFIVELTKNTTRGLISWDTDAR